MIKFYTDIEQSKQLAKILSLESADMCYGIDDDTLKYNNLPWLIPYHRHTAKEFYIPCWSLAALLDVFPEGVIKNYYIPNIQKENGTYSIAYGNDELLCIADNPIDACYEMILKLKEKNLL